MSIKEDLRKKIDAISKRMDSMLESNDFRTYNQLADTYLKLVREYEELNKPKKYFEGCKPFPYFTTDAVSKNPLEWNEIKLDSNTPYAVHVQNLNLTTSDPKEFVKNLTESLRASQIK